MKASSDAKAAVAAYKVGDRFDGAFGAARRYSYTRDQKGAWAVFVHEYLDALHDRFPVGVITDNGGCITQID